MDKDRFRFALEMYGNAGWDEGFGAALADLSNVKKIKDSGRRLRDEAIVARQKYLDELMAMVEENNHG